MIPEIIQVRKDICRDCHTPCEVLPDPNKPCSRCSLSSPRWNTFGHCDSIERPTVNNPEKLRGLGDAVAVIANPIAKIIGLDKSKCGCAARQEALNKLVPFSSLPK